MGQFQVSDPLFKGDSGTHEPYKITALPPVVPQDLKYDRGIIFEKDFKTGTTLVGEIVNGCGIGEANDLYLFDKDKYKNFMLRINQSISKYISIGIFGYTGKEVVSGPFSVTDSEIKMFGPDLTIDIDEKLIINAQYVSRIDSRVFMGTPSTVENDVMTSGVFTEIIYAPKGDMSKWYLTGLFNWVESDYDDLDYTSATLHAGYLLRRNMRVVGEFTQVTNPVHMGSIVGVITAF
jgi:hypothetical protein